MWTNSEALPPPKMSFDFQDAMCHTVCPGRGLQGGWGAFCVRRACEFATWR